MAKVTKKYVFYPASLGLDQSTIPGAQDPRGMWDCDNVIFTTNGSRKKFWGIEKYSLSGIAPHVMNNMRGIFDYWRNESGVMTQKVVCAAGGRLFSDDDNGIFYDVTGPTVLLPTDSVTFDAFYGIIVACFGASSPLIWDQSGVFENLDAVAFAVHAQHIPSYDVVTNPNPIFSICRVHGQRLWLAGNPLYPHRIYYSSVGDPLDWRIAAPGNAGSIDLDIEDSDPEGITGIFPTFHGDLYVAKRRSIYRIREEYSADLGTTTFVVDRVFSGVGCVWHNTIAATPNDIIWASDRGVHSLAATDKFGDVEHSFLSFPIHESYRRDVSFNRRRNMSAVFEPGMNSYLLALTTIGNATNNRMICYNIVLGQWYQKKNFDCACLANYTDFNAQTRTLVGREDGLQIGLFNEDRTSDFDKAMSMYITTPLIYPSGNQSETMDYKKLWLFFRPQDTGTITIVYNIDNKGQRSKSVLMNYSDTTAQRSTFVEGPRIGFFRIGSGIIGSETDEDSVQGGLVGPIVKKVAVPLVGSGEGIQFLFYNSANSVNPEEDCEIYGFMIEAESAEDADSPTIG